MFVASLGTPDDAQLRFPRAGGTVWLFALAPSDLRRTHRDTRAVDAVIKRLRNKLRESASDLDLIVTVRGVGYKLRVE